MTASLYITELTTISYVGHSNILHAQVPAVDVVPAFQVVSASSTTARSAATNAKTKFLKLVADTDMWINYGSVTVNATIGSDYLPAGVIYYVGLSPGSYVACITA